jgi:hypothetical protein
MSWCLYSHSQAVLKDRACGSGRHSVQRNNVGHAICARAAECGLDKPQPAHALPWTMSRPASKARGQLQIYAVVPWSKHAVSPYEGVMFLLF